VTLLAVSVAEEVSLILNLGINPAWVSLVIFMLSTIIHNNAVQKVVEGKSPIQTSSSKGYKLVQCGINHLNYLV
jgi:hypothetical protein